MAEIPPQAHLPEVIRDRIPVGPAILCVSERNIELPLKGALNH